MAEKILKVEHLKKSYDGKTNVLDDISFGIEKGEVVVIVGPSGCGKSTIAKLISGKNKIYTGDIKIGGISVSHISETELMKHVTRVHSN